MSDPDDDEALTWAGDDRLQAPTMPAPHQPEARGSVVVGRSGDGLGLVALGLFGGVAVLETIGWARAAFAGPLAATLTTGDGSPLAVAAFVGALLGHLAAAAAPLIWAAVVVVRLPAAAPRIAWFALGAVVLLPWPVVLGIR
jgi:hypothetical protein